MQEPHQNLAAGRVHYDVLRAIVLDRPPDGHSAPTRPTSGVEPMLDLRTPKKWISSLGLLAPSNWKDWRGRGCGDWDKEVGIGTRVGRRADRRGGCAEDRKEWIGERKKMMGAAAEGERDGGREAET